MINRRVIRSKTKPGFLALCILSAAIISLDAAKAGLPPGDSLMGIVRSYAEAMIENGRDIYGSEHSPLFAAALDRKTMRLGYAEDFGAIPGVRVNDRSLGGANPQEDTDLYMILYELSDLTGDRKYAREADRALEFFFNHCQSPATGLMAWGEHLFWDFKEEQCRGTDMHEIEGEWPFWDQCYRLAPEASWRFAIGQWDHQVYDRKTGDFSRHARWSAHGPGSGFDFPRYAGQMIVNWTDALIREENRDRERREELLEAVSVIVNRMEENSGLTGSGYLPAGRAKAGEHIDVVWMGSNLELARCLWKSAPDIYLFDRELSQRMRTIALKQDSDFHKAPHEITEGGGFAVTLHSQTGEPRHRQMNKPYTAVWATGYGHSTHANMANLCYERYVQLQEEFPDLAGKYRKLIIAAADQYLSETPDAGELQKPDAFAAVIGLMINANNISGDEKYIERALYFSRIGIELFLTEGLPLPQATSHHQHYEAITGGPSFMYALLRLYRKIEL